MNIYKEELLDHFENPRNKGVLKKEGERVLETKSVNVSCGDEIRFFIKIKGEEGEKVVEDVRWDGSCCVISSAVASKLSEWLRGKKIVDLKKMKEEGVVENVLGWKVSPGREGCFLLPVRVVKDLVKRA